MGGNNQSIAVISVRTVGDPASAHSNDALLHLPIFLSYSVLSAACDTKIVSSNSAIAPM